MPRDQSCDISVKNVTALDLWLKSLPEMKVKDFALISLAEEITKQPRIDSVFWVLVVILMDIYNAKGKTKQIKT